MIENLNAVMGNILTDYSWFYEARRTAKEMKTERVDYPEEFIDKVCVPEVLDYIGASEELAAKVMTDKSQMTFVMNIVPLLCKAAEERFGPFAGTDEEGNVQIASFNAPDGSINTPAMMKAFRKVRYENYMRRRGIKYGRLKKSAPYSNLSEEFMRLACTKQFLSDVGMPENDINALRNAYSKGNSNYLAACLNTVLGGNFKEAKPGVFSSGWISREFSRRKTALDQFIDQFRSENKTRMANRNGKYWPPFSDAFIIKAHNRELLEKIGMAPEGIEKIMKINIQNGLNDYSRNNISIPLGMYGSKAEKIVNDSPQKKRQVLTKDSGIVSIYYELAHENAESYAIHRQKADMDLMRYSDSLIDRLFETGLMKEALTIGNNKWTTSLNQWVSMLPEDCTLYTIGFSRERLTKVLDTMWNEPDAHTSDLVGLTGDEDATYVIAAFNMLMTKKYVSGDSEAFWTGMSQGQRNSFRTAIGKSILHQFKQYRDANPDLFPKKENPKDNGNKGNNGNK